MNDTKAITSANYCVPIRELFRSVEAERTEFVLAWEAAGRRVEELNQLILAETDPVVKQRLNAESVAALREFQRLDKGKEQRLEDFEKRLRDIRNDYRISGCDDILGPL